MLDPCSRGRDLLLRLRRSLGSGTRRSRQRARARRLSASSRRSRPRRRRDEIEMELDGGVAGGRVRGRSLLRRRCARDSPRRSSRQATVDKVDGRSAHLNGDTAIPAQRPVARTDQDSTGVSDLYVVDNKVAVGGTTGWHSHLGPSLIFVLAGTISNYHGDDPTCTPHIVHRRREFRRPGRERRAHAAEQRDGARRRRWRCSSCRRAPNGRSTCRRRRSPVREGYLLLSGRAAPRRPPAHRALASAQPAARRRRHTRGTRRRRPASRCRSAW